MSRPDTYTPELANRICGLLGEGASLRKICRKAGMPDMATVLQWLAQHPDFAQQYAQARDIQAESLADEIVDIADSAEGLDSAGISAAKLRVDARKWAVTKRLARPGGDRVEAGNGLPIATQLSPEALQDLARQLADEV